MTSRGDWVMRPVLEGMCKYESTRDGTLDLNDIAEMNEALDVREENTRRLAEAHSKRGGR